jgi:SAM-dependent methyltransferase
MNIINFNNKSYPEFQAQGNASQFAIPFAKQFCIGTGYDIGCNRIEWSFPGSIPIDPVISSDFDAYNLPTQTVDYIYSSHCLEHLPDWVAALDYWTKCIKSKGILFLYLPHYSQEYWRPWNNKKHKHIFTPEILRDYLSDNGYENIFYSEKDLNNSFMIVGEKK